MSAIAANCELEFILLLRMITRRRELVWEHASVQQLNSCFSISYSLNEISLMFAFYLMLPIFIFTT